MVSKVIETNAPLLVTGGAGFIGSRLVLGLNALGYRNIWVIDNLSLAVKMSNLVKLDIAHYLDKHAWRELLKSGASPRFEAIFHQGACSDTMQHDGRYMMDNNYQCSLELLDFAQRYEIPMLYASSAAVYGAGQRFDEHREAESPLNVYGYSKFLFDQVVRQRMDQGLRAPIYGFRYFNVYGPHEAHKGRMASVAYHQYQQWLNQGYVTLFEGCDGYANGQQQRDFIYVDDVVAVNLHFLKHGGPSGIYNLGTGRAQSFNDVALSVVNVMRKACKQQSPLSLEQAVTEGLIRYVSFPEALKGKYQSFTEANLSNLRAAGCYHEFATVQQGVEAYLLGLLGNTSLRPHEK